ncbi:MAG TPA: class I SAM-dependent DNA methyltransferase, partial [Anaerolineales bacterium]|nr:class I SAM-dependent DNA methyltransferase [Anaerolineales bacterium]
MKESIQPPITLHSIHRGREPAIHNTASAQRFRCDAIIDPMLTSNFQNSGLRQKVDQLMDILWAGGVNNPMDSIEQLSYLIFLRLMSERDEEYAALSKKYSRIFSGEWAKYQWGNFVTLAGDPLFDAVRSAIEKLHELPGMSETGRLLFNRATLKIYDRPTLRAVIQVINDMDLGEHEGNDLKGDMYEYLLSKLSTSGTNGQFRTPRHIIDLIVALVDPQPGESIADPACGTAGFLVSAFNHIKRGHTSQAELSRGRATGDLLTTAQWTFIENRAFTGYDNDANMVKIAILNLYLHKLEKADIRFHNPLTAGIGSPYPGRTFDVILANPPFAGKIQQESILADLNLSTRSTELLFVKWFLDHLSPRGRAGIIVPIGVLFGGTNAAIKVRELLINEYGLQAVINLPSGVFKPYSGVGTAILILDRSTPTALTGTSPKADEPQSDLGEAGRGSRSIWFYDLTADGFSLDDKRTPTEASDLPDVLAKWPGRDEGPNSYRVP